MHFNPLYSYLSTMTFFLCLVCLLWLLALAALIIVNQPVLPSVVVACVFRWFLVLGLNCASVFCVCAWWALMCKRLQWSAAFSPLSWFVSTQRKPEEESPVKDTDAKQAKRETTVNGSSESTASNSNAVQGKSQEASDGLVLWRGSRMAFRLFAAWRARIAWREVAKTRWFVLGLLVVQSGSSF